MHKNQKRVSLLLLTVPCCILFFLTFLKLPPVEQVEKLFLNYYLSNQEISAPDEKIILIAGSDRSVAEIGTWPWSRDIHARLIEDYLMGAKTIALDILFADQSNAQADLALRDAIERHGNVVLAYVEEDTGKSAIHSLDSLIGASAGEGFVNGFPDSDGIVRTYSLIQEKQVLSPSFVSAVLMASGYHLDWDFYSDKSIGLKLSSPSGDVKGVSLEENFRFLRFPFARNYYTVYDYADVLSGKVPKSTFDNAIVFVGMNMAGATDVVTTLDGIITGTQFNVDSFVSILSGANVLRLSSFGEALLAAVLFTVVWLLSVRVSRKTSWIIWVIALIFCIGGTRLLFLKQVVWIATVPLVLSIISAYLFALINNLITAQGKLNTQSISIDSLFTLEATFTGQKTFEAFSDFYETLAPTIEETYGLKVLKSMVNGSDEELIAYGAMDNVDNLMIAYHVAKPPFRHRVIIRFPVMGDILKEPQYSILGMSHKQDITIIKSLATLVSTSYIFFHAAKDANEKMSLFYSLIECMISAVDAKDPVTSGHSKRVAQVSQQIANALSLTPAQVEQIRFAGMIHDIGKIGIPDEVLRKPGPFSKMDFEIMKEHPVMGASIIEPIHLDPNILDGILFHHERIDGKGYPYGKTGDQLSLTAKIIKVADVYDALTSERQYKKPWPLDQVLNLFYEGRGTEFDRDIVDIFIEQIKPFGWQPSTKTDSQNSIMSSALSIYESIFDKFQQLIRTASVGKQDMPFHSIDCSSYYKSTCTNDFYGVTWYERPMSISFLEHHPIVIHAKEEDLFFALQGTGPVKSVIYYFYRGYLTGGAITCKASAAGDMEELFGAPISSTPSFQIYDNSRMHILCSERLVVYIMKSILEI